MCILNNQNRKKSEFISNKINDVRTEVYIRYKNCRYLITGFALFYVMIIQKNNRVDRKHLKYVNTIKKGNILNIKTFGN